MLSTVCLSLIYRTLAQWQKLNIEGFATVIYFVSPRHTHLSLISTESNPISFWGIQDETYIFSADLIASSKTLPKPPDTSADLSASRLTGLPTITTPPIP